MTVHSVCIDVPGVPFNPGPLAVGWRRRGLRAVLAAYPVREQARRVNAPNVQRGLRRRFFYMFKRKRTPKVPPLLRQSGHAYSRRVWLAGVGGCPCAGRTTIRRIDRICATRWID